MSRFEIRPLRFVLIGILLTVLTASLLLPLVLTGRLSAGVALAGMTFVGGVAAIVLRMLYADTRMIADYADRVRESPVPLPAPVPNAASAETLLSGIARAHAAWLDRHERSAAEMATVEAVVEALHDPLVLVGPDRRVARANSAARGLFGERMMGRDLAATLRNPALLEAVAAVLAGGASRTVEFVLPVPVERTLEARVKPFGRPGHPSTPGEEGERSVLVTLHDITLLKRSEQMRADFVANASHELRTPLSSLLGFIETLRGPARDDTEARDRFLGIMHDQAGRMSRLVNDLLSLSRIELDEHSPPTGRADLSRIVRSVAATLELKAAARRIRLVVQAPGGPIMVVGDEDQLAQVAQNLMENAIKYGRDSSDVTVAISGPDAGAPGMATGLRKGERLVVLSVTDRGEGIPRTHLPRLTERFYRVDPARSRALGGTGLGLAIVKHIVNRHRGRLTIDSEVGRGSTFSVHLPAAEARATDMDDRTSSVA